MSIRGTIFPAEASKTYEEMVGHLSRFVASNADEATKLEGSLLQKLELVKQTFLLGGSLTLDATRTLITIKKEEKTCWRKGMKIDTCTSKNLAEKVALFWKSGRQKEGWIISQVVQETGLLRPHQMPLLFAKRNNGISFLTFDTRMNFEGIRTPLLEALLPLGIPIQLYLSKQKRQHDWSTCSQISLDDLHQLDHLGTEQMFAFLEAHADSVETQQGGKWTLTVSERVPLSHMRLVQWLDDFKNYEAWALKSLAPSQTLVQRLYFTLLSLWNWCKSFFEKMAPASSPQPISTLNNDIASFKEKMKSKNPEWTNLEPEKIDLNRRGIHRFRKNITKLIQRILNDQSPIKECFENPNS
jgi:hypothetical protein